MVELRQIAIVDAHKAGWPVSKPVRITESNQPLFKGPADSGMSAMQRLQMATAPISVNPGKSLNYGNRHCPQAPEGN